MADTSSDKYKMIVIGDQGVGKTYLIRAFCEDEAKTGNYKATVGLDVKKKVINLDDFVVRLEIWDTAGQERFHSLIDNYYRNAKGVIVMYDITKRASFNNVLRWIKNCEEKANTDFVKVLVGNKCDVTENERAVTIEMGQQLANELGMPFFEASSTKNINIEQSFLMLAKQIRKQDIIRKEEEARNLEAQREDRYVNLNAHVDLNNDTPHVKADSACSCSLL